MGGWNVVVKSAAKHQSGKSKDQNDLQSIDTAAAPTRTRVVGRLSKRMPRWFVMAHARVVIVEFSSDVVCP
eukprot:SAG31_NODE_1012_length_10379_cov_3.699319_1_plen_71_part_00